MPCLEKGDIIFLFDANWGTSLKTESTGETVFGGAGHFTEYTDTTFAVNQWSYNNFAQHTGVPYTITKIYKKDPTYYTQFFEDRYVIDVDRKINWSGYNLTDPDGDGNKNTGNVQIVKFSPATTGNYEFVSECSNRGSCMEDLGMCDCYSGYKGTSCDKQDALAM